jgi:hypothetical protein
MTFIACVVYPANKYAGTNFGAASVEELEVAGAATEAACLTAQTFGPVVEIVGKVTINGIVFLHTTGTGGALGHYLKTDHYRAFHENKCYDLSTNVTASEFANFDPGTIKEFTHEDERHVRKELTEIVKSFRFLK